MNTNSLTLYPFEKETLLISAENRTRVLQVTVFLLEHLGKAINDFFIHPSYSQFDGHIGDQLCLVRAYALIVLKNKESSPSAEQKIYFSQLLQRAQMLLNKELEENKNPEILKQKKAPVSLKDFLHQTNLAFQLDENLAFLTRLHILRKYRTLNAMMSAGRMEVTTLSKVSGLGLEKAGHLIKSFQKNISEISAQLVLSLTKDNPAYTALLERMIIKNNQGLSLTPCFETIKIILDDFIQQSGGLLVRVARYVANTGKQDVVELAFSSTPNAPESFQARDPSSIKSSTQAMIVCRAAMTYPNQPAYLEDTPENFKNRLLKIGIYNVILAEAAFHQQYTDTTLPELVKKNHYHLLKNEAGEFSNVTEEQAHYLADAENKFTAHQASAEKIRLTICSMKHFYCDTPAYHYANHL